MRRALIALALLAASPITAAAQARGWQAYDLGGGRRATRYVPTSVRLCEALPVAVFFHGAGGTPEAYHPHLEAHAEALGLTLLLPQAMGMGWSGADTSTVNAALAALEAEGIVVDGRRTYFAGHSAGGAFAYLLTYDGSTGVAAVFSMSAPFHPISSRSDPDHAAPIRMYYGDTDPNYTGGSAAMLEGQWTRLGVPSETDVQAGYGHSTWPPSSIAAGLSFLLAQTYPGAPTPSRCGDADAGSSDAGRLDAGVAAPDAPGLDAARADASSDVGPRERGVTGGCACTAGAPASPRFALVLLSLVLAVVRARGGGGPRTPSRRSDPSGGRDRRRAG